MVLQDFFFQRNVFKRHAMLRWVMTVGGLAAAAEGSLGWREQKYMALLSAVSRQPSFSLSNCRPLSFAFLAKMGMILRYCLRTMKLSTMRINVP